MKAYVITVEEIAALVNSDGNKIDDPASTVDPHRISNKDGVKALETSNKIR